MLPSSTESFTPVMVTVCGVFQLVWSKKRKAGETVPSVVSLDERLKITLFPPPGLLSRTAVKVAVPPASVVTRPDVGLIVMPAARLDGHCVSTLVENGLTGRGDPFS